MFVLLLGVQPFILPLASATPVGLLSSSPLVVVGQSRVDTSDIRFGYNARVNDLTSPYLYQVDPTMSILSDGRVLVGWKETNEHNGTGQRVSFAYSDDGGGSWSPSVFMDRMDESMDADDYQSDPWLITDQDDNAYFIFTEYNNIYFNYIPEGVGVAKSTDGGVTWSDPVQASDTWGHDNQITACVDPSGDLCLVWEHWSDRELVFTKSTDSGGSFQSTQNISDSWVPYISSSDNGTLLISTWVEGDSILLLRSGDGGATWPLAFLVNSTGPDGLDYVTAVDTTSNGDIYVAYSAGTTTDRDVYVVKSLNGGRNWTDPIQVNDNPSGMQRQVTMLIDDDDNIHLAWLDSRHGEWHRYYSYSSDAGTTFSPGLQITSDGTLLSLNQPGYYFSLKEGPDGLCAAWTGGQGYDLDIFFAKQDHTAPVITHTPATLGFAATPFTLTATVSDDDHVDTVMLYCGVSATDQARGIHFSEISNNLYQAVIPAEEMMGGYLEYYILANDSAGRITRLPAVEAEYYPLSISPITPSLVLTIAITGAIVAALVYIVVRKRRQTR